MKIGKRKEEKGKKKKERRKRKEEKGITLIALVITIIVLLILAGVALSLVVGENGIVSRTIKARDVHNIAGIQEKANLAYHDSLIGGYAQDGVYHPVDLGTVLAQLVTDGDITSATPAGGTSITGFTLSESSVELGVGDSATVTATPTSSEGNGDYEVVIDGQTYLAHMESGNIVIDKDPMTSGGPSFEISNVSSSNAAVTAEKTSATVVTVTANSTGTSTVTVSYGSVDKTFTVTVATKYTVNLYASSDATTATAITVVEGTKASDATEYALPAVPEGKVFDKWLLKTAVGSNAVGSDATSLLNNVTQDLSVYATFKSPSWADLHPANPYYINDFGKEVTGYSPVGGGKWRLFYAEGSGQGNGTAYLIRDRIGNTGYELNDASVVKGWNSSEVSSLAQSLNPKFTSWTAQAGNNNIKAVAALLDKDQWTDYSNNSSDEPIATWALGAPPVEMFIASYNATHETQLDSTVESVTSTGYKVKIGSGNFDTYARGLGNTSDLDKAIYCNDSYNWWLASPSAYDYDSVMYVENSGILGYIIYGLNAGVRPLVSVPLSSFGTSNDSIIKIKDSY